MKTLKSKFSVAVAFTVFGLTACGSDSTGPSNLDAASALHSLALGLQQMGTTGTTATLDTDASFGGIAPFLSQVTVGIDGQPQTMFALALHETFPTGTCWETIFQDVIPADPNACTPPPLGLALILWQSHSASERPDRIAFLAGDVGTSDFAFDLNSSALPAIGILAEGDNDFWVSQSGTLSSAVSATAQSCDIPLPLYAKSGHCSIATFDEQGSVVLAHFDMNGAATNTRTLTILRQTLHGLWVVITEVQPIGLTATRLLPAALRQIPRLGAK